MLGIVLSGSNIVRGGSSVALVHSSFSGFESRGWYLDEFVLVWGSKLDILLENLVLYLDILL